METPVGFTWLLQEEAQEYGKLLPDVEDILFLEEYLMSADKKKLLQEKMMVSGDTIQQVYWNTIGQAKNATWLTCRKHRLTASHFGAVIAAIRRGKYPISLFKRLPGVYNLEHVHAVQFNSLRK